MKTEPLKGPWSYCSCLKTHATVKSKAIDCMQRMTASSAAFEDGFGFSEDFSESFNPLLVRGSNVGPSYAQAPSLMSSFRGLFRIWDMF